MPAAILSAFVLAYFSSMLEWHVCLYISKFRSMYWNMSYGSLVNSSLYNLTGKDTTLSYFFFPVSTKISFSNLSLILIIYNI